MAIESSGFTVALPIPGHVFVQAFTPPLPLIFCLIAAGLAVAVSFILVAFFARNPQAFLGYPRINLLKWKTMQFLNDPALLFPIQFISVFLLILLVSVGFVGNQNPLHNLSPTFVWVIWWVGIAYASAFIGDIWAFTNPWKILFVWTEKLWVKMSSGKPFYPMFQYPPKFGVWPALVLFGLFAWVENVYGGASIPFRISQMIVVYSIITWGGMILFGKDIWLRNGEAFSVAFGFLARFAPAEASEVKSKSSSTFARAGSNYSFKDEFVPSSRSDFSSLTMLNLRPFASGLLNTGTVSVSQMLFVLVFLATVTFDGFAATLLWIKFKGFMQEYLPDLWMISTLGLVSTVLIFVALYLCVCALVGKASRIDMKVLDVGKAFVYTLIPIALAYHVAHFLLFLLIQGQLIVPLVSDPFGFGWDLFGTANYRLNFQIVSPNSYWLISVISIVIGHIVAVFLGHSTAFSLISKRHYALRSQIPMLVLMVAYTIASLWIITQPMYMAQM
ncbi:MAG: hypothetical protein CL786_04375 [Chloroflexi bacterium]|nr:hypothetical protein [Chloroflexota bacterium]|tara:strand:+ start:5008 stop:6513 length:1506 start_codon:yes stop_codon:yes gene_type:complete